MIPIFQNTKKRILIPIFPPNIIFGPSLTHFPSKYKHQINTTKKTTNLNIHNSYKHNNPFSQKKKFKLKNTILKIQIIVKRKKKEKKEKGHLCCVEEEDEWPFCMLKGLVDREINWILTWLCFLSLDLSLNLGLSAILKMERTRGFETGKEGSQNQLFLLILLEYGDGYCYIC